MKQRYNLDAVLNSSGDPIYVLDVELNYELANEAYLLRRGVSLEELTGRNYSDFHSPEMAAEFAGIVRAVIERGEPISHHHESEDGSFFLRTISPIVKIDDSVPAVVVNSKDITELRTSEERYRSLVEVNPDVIFRLDADGNIEFISPNVRDLLIYKQADLIGKHISSILCEEYLGCVWQIATKRTADRRTNGLEVKLKKSDDSSVSAEIRSVGVWAKVNAVGVYEYGYQGDGREESRGTCKDSLVGTHGVISNITERKQTEAALIKSEMNYRSLVEDMPQLICRLLPDGSLTYVNEAYCRFAQKTADELIGFNFLDLIPEEAREAVRVGYMALTPDNPVETHEQLVEVPGQERRWHEWTNRAFFDGEGNPIEIQALGYDITDRKRYEEELTRTRQLVTLTEVMTNFIGDSLNNRLAGVAGLLSLMAIDIENEDLNASISILTALQVGLIQYQHAAAPTDNISKGNLDIQEILGGSGGLISTNKFVSYDKNEYSVPSTVVVRYIADGGTNLDELPEVVGNASLIRRAVQESLINAVESKGSKESIYVDVSARREGEMLVLSITDNGEGMHPNELELCQLPFYKVSSLKTSGRFGLGAYIASQSAKACGGDIKIMSEKDVGTTVEIYLPLAKK